jgi:hypothetical protein
LSAIFEAILPSGFREATSTPVSGVSFSLFDDEVGDDHSGEGDGGDSPDKQSAGPGVGSVRGVKHRMADQGCDGSDSGDREIHDNDPLDAAIPRGDFQLEPGRTAPRAADSAWEVMFSAANTAQHGHGSSVEIFHSELTYH